VSHGKKKGDDSKNVFFVPLGGGSRSSSQGTESNWGSRAAYGGKKASGQCNSSAAAKGTASRRESMQKKLYITQKKGRESKRSITILHQPPDAYKKSSRLKGV